MISFEFTPQRNGDLVVDRYCEDGRHVGGVARVSGIAGGKPKVRFTKPVSLLGLAEILERLDAELRPQPAEAATSPPPPPESTKTRRPQAKKGN